MYYDSGENKLKLKHNFCIVHLYRVRGVTPFALAFRSK